MQFSRIQERRTEVGNDEIPVRTPALAVLAVFVRLNGPLQNGIRAGGYLEFRVPPGGRGL
jgi:hypothetical protein